MSAILESLNAFSAAGLSAVLNTLWLALAVAAVIWLALRLMPRVNAATRHAIWWAVLALVVLMPLATLFPRPAPSVPSPARTERQIRTRSQSSPSAVKPLVAPDADAPAPPLTSAPLHALYSRAAAAPRVRVPIEFHPGNWPSRLLFLWMAVSCVLLGRIVQSYLHLRGLRNRARPASAELVVRFEQRLRDSRTSRAPQVLVSDEVISPLAAGFLPPVVILPDLLLEKIGEAELDYVLFHELAHVVRRDDWSNLMGRLASAAFVLHPVAAWVLRRIEREREIACDDWVVAATGSPQPYARSLARLFELCASRPVTILASGIGGRGSNLGDRIALLLERGRAFGTGVSLARVGSFAMLLIAIAALAARSPVWIALAQSPARPSEPPHEVRVGKESFLAGLVAAGYGDLPVDDIIHLKNQGVSADYLLRMSRAGWGKLGPSVVIGLKQHGVDPDYVREIHELGFGPYTPGLVIELKNHGVPVDLLRALKEYGITQASTAELIEARNCGVGAHNLREARGYGNKLTLRQIIRLKQAGVI